MRRLSEPIATLVGACLDGGGACALRGAALGALQGIVGYDEGHFVPFTDEFFAIAPPYLAEFVREPRYARDLRRAVEVAGERGTYVDTDVYSARERDRLRLYRELLGPAGIASQVVALLRVGGRLSGVIHLNRLGTSRAFTADELAATEETLRATALLHAALVPIAGGDDDAARQLTQRLSPRQIDIALLVAEGFQNVQVAGHLGLSERTIKNQVSEIFARLGLYSRAELALLCERAGLLRGSVGERGQLARVLRSVSSVMASA